MLFGAGTTGVNRVQVHLQVVGNVPTDHRALQEMDVVEAVANPGGIVQILNPAFAVVVAFDIDHVDRRPGGAIVHAAA